MKKFTVILCIATVFAMLTGCANQAIQNTSSNEQEKETTPIMYTNRFPKTMNSKLETFLNDYISYNDSVFQLDGGNVIFAENYTPEPRKQNHLEYYTISKKEMETLYGVLKEAESKEDEFASLSEKAESLRQSADADQMNLPLIETEDKNGLKLSTESGQQAIDIQAFSEKKPSMEHLEISLLNSTEKDFLLSVYNWKEKRHFLLFAKQDLSELTIVEDAEKELADAYKKGKLSKFGTLFKQFGSSDKYEVLLMKVSGKIFDKEQKSLVNIKESDILSKDGKQVYVAGETPEDGEQKIMTLESYLNGNEKQKKTFVIDGKAIAKVAGLKESATLQAVETVYMLEDFVILHIMFNNYIADAGSVNVLVNLSGENPQMHIVDLGLQAGLGF